MRCCACSALRRFDSVGHPPSTPPDGRRMRRLGCLKQPKLAMASLISDHASRLQWIFLHLLHMRRKRPSAGVQAVAGMAGRSSVCDVRQRCSTSSSTQSDVHTHITPQRRRVATEPQIIPRAYAASYLRTSTVRRWRVSALQMKSHNRRASMASPPKRREPRWSWRKRATGR